MSFIFNGNEDPRQREMRLRQQQMSGITDGMTQMPQNAGEGLSAVAQALTYRRLQEKQAQAAADPWSGMRQTTPSNPIAGMARGLTGLFGLGSGR